MVFGPVRRMLRRTFLRLRARSEVTRGCCQTLNLGTFSNHSPDTDWHWDRRWHCFDSGTPLQSEPARLYHPCPCWSGTKHGRARPHGGLLRTRLSSSTWRRIAVKILQVYRIKPELIREHFGTEQSVLSSGGRAAGFRPWGPKRSRSGAITRLFNSALAASCGRALKGGQQEARGVGATPHRRVRRPRNRCVA